MSIRNIKFEQEVVALWEEIEILTADVSSAGLSTEEVDEIAHLKKVVKYISDMLKAIDPDFIPMKVLDTVKTPINNIKNSLQTYHNFENFSYIRSINDNYLDTLLRDLMPFIFYKGNAASALRNALNQYTETIQEHYQSYLNDIKSYVEKSKNDANDSEIILNDLLSKREEISLYAHSLFNENDGIENQISELTNNFQNKNDEINKFYQEIFDEESGIEKRIKGYLDDGKEQNTELHSLKDESSKTLIELEDFYDDIFGKEDESGERVGGLKNELNTRRLELENFKIKQQERYSELNTQIENLLPGATSAGLSSAYNAMHTKFDQEVQSYGKFFYGSLFILFLIVIAVTFWFPNKSNSLIDNNQVTQVSMQAETKVGDKEKTGNSTPASINTDSSISSNNTSLSHRLVTMLDGFTHRLPFVLPAIWLVLFISRRRSEAQRLAQEYAHKEALAKSYESYKQQIEKLGEDEQNRLIPILLENMLKAIALNPAETLDKNHKEATPIEEVIKKKEFWDYLEKVKGLITPKDKS